MTIAEIIILIIGAILFTVSFIIPERNSIADNGVSPEEVKKAVKNAIDEEVNRVKLSIDDASNESISDGKDKMERYMDRITNEKMMAVSEYSDTVLEQIHKDHQEAVFLYDMIDSKYKQVKNAAAELNQLEKSVRALSEEIPNVAPTTKSDTTKKVAEAKTVKKSVAKENKSKNESIASKNKKVETVNFEPIEAEKVVVTLNEEVAPIVVEEASENEVKANEAIDVANVTGQGTIELMFDSDSNSMNNNDRILALHKEGKSNMAIAKELGLGVGEVKLVIDLFKN